VNTWSVEAFVDEGLQPAELGWGTHERHWPADAKRHGFGSDAAIYLQRPGIATRVRSWTPLEGPYHGFLVTHAESISIADYLTLREGGETVYRPTVHYAYHPCDDAVLSLHECAGKNWQVQHRQRIMRDEITQGMDELGVLLMGNPKGVYWYGSRLTIGQARELAPYNSATSLQVVAGILGGMVWALRHPDAGLVGPRPPDGARSRDALPRRSRRRVGRLDTAEGSQRIVPGTQGPRRPLAVPEFPRRLKASHTAIAAQERTRRRRELLV
jgi:homospermidine synthase